MSEFCSFTYQWAIFFFQSVSVRTAHSLCVVSEHIRGGSLAVALIGVLIKEIDHLKKSRDRSITKLGAVIEKCSL